MRRAQTITAQAAIASEQQKVRNKNNIADMYLQRTLKEYNKELSSTVLQIEMEKLDWRGFMKTVKLCESDDLPEFAPLFYYLYDGTETAYMGRRTRIKDLCKGKGMCMTPEGAPPIKAQKKVKSAAELSNIRPEFQRSKTMLTRKSAPSGGQIILERELTSIQKGTASKREAFPHVRIRAALEGGEDKTNEGEITVKTKRPQDAKSNPTNRSGFAKISASIRREIPIIEDDEEVEVGHKKPTTPLDGRLSQSLPNIPEELVQGHNNNAEKYITATLRENPTLMRDILDINATKFPSSTKPEDLEKRAKESKSGKRHKKRKPLPERIHAFYKKLNESNLTEENRPWYLPPIKVSPT